MATSATKIKIQRVLLPLILSTFTASCTVVGPEYVQPNVDVPTTYKEAPTAISATSIPSNDDTWWTIYQDDDLNKLITQIEVNNYALQTVEARVQQAKSLVTIDKAAQSPTVSAGGKNDLGVLVNWEVDLWGRIQRNIEASGAAAQASEADLAATKLSLQAQLAQNYFLLRTHDADIQLLQSTIDSYAQSLEITRNQYKAGIADRSNVAQEQAQLSTAQVQIYDARIMRAQLEHTIAVLIGKAPSEFSISISTNELHLPEVPLSLPSDLLDRRPDIVAAERRVAMTSAKIGVAESAAYPTLGLGIGASIRHGLIGGSDLVAPIYTAGATQGLLDGAKAAHDEATANYHQTILNSFREVEDNLVTLQILAKSADAQTEAIAAAREVVELTNNQYHAGVVTYQSLIIAQAFTLSNERAALGILGRRLIASIMLIKALGGGWEEPMIEQ